MGRHKLTTSNKPTTLLQRNGPPNKKRGRPPKREHWTAKKRRLALEGQQRNGRDDKDLQAYCFRRECDENRGGMSRQSGEATRSNEGGGEGGGRSARGPSDERCQLLPDDEKTTDAISERNTHEKPNDSSGAAAAADLDRPGINFKAAMLSPAAQEDSNSSCSCERDKSPQKPSLAAATGSRTEAAAALGGPSLKATALSSAQEDCRKSTREELHSSSCPPLAPGLDLQLGASDTRRKPDRSSADGRSADVGRRSLERRREKAAAAAWAAGAGTDGVGGNDHAGGSERPYPVQPPHQPRHQTWPSPQHGQLQSRPQQPPRETSGTAAAAGAVVDEQRERTERNRLEAQRRTRTGASLDAGADSRARSPSASAAEGGPRADRGDDAPGGVGRDAERARSGMADGDFALPPAASSAATIFQDVEAEIDAAAARFHLPAEEKSKLVDEAYRIVQRLTGDIGGNGQGAAMYGEMIKSSCQKAIDLLVEHACLGPESRFIDIGCGRAKPNIHAALYARVGFSYGIELDRCRVYLANSILKMLLKNARGNPNMNTIANVSLQLGDISEASCLDPFTHVWMFDVA